MHDDPEHHLSQAVTVFNSVGAVSWRRRATAQAKTLGVTMTSARRTRQRRRGSAGLQLTPTEVQLVDLLQQGLTNRQVASILHYSTKTIEVYLSRLYQKVGCHSRVELVVAAQRGDLESYLN